MSSFKSKRSPIRKRTMAAIVALGVAAGGLGTYAVANDVVSDYDHFIACFDILLADPVRHKRNCLPNRVKVEFGTLAGGSSGAPSIPAPSPT